MAGIEASGSGGRPYDWLAPAQMLRSARRAARLSQREVAARAAVPPSTIGRIESGETRDPSIGVVRRLLEATDHALVAVDRGGRPLGRHPDEEEMDRGGRYYPAHLDLEEVNDPWDPFGRVYWWGWWRIAWSPGDPRVPERTFVRARNEFYNRPVRGP